MYYGVGDSWNLRDPHMFDTLQSLLAFYGPDSKGIVWEHNSHVGDAAATEMSARGEHNVGQLCREAFGDRALHRSASAPITARWRRRSDWDEPMQLMRVRPAHRRELRAALPRLRRRRRSCCTLREPRAARGPRRARVAAPRARDRRRLPPRDRARRATTSRRSCPHQFDEYIWFDETRAVQPADRAAARPRFPAAHPFSLTSR